MLVQIQVTKCPDRAPGRWRLSKSLTGACVPLPAASICAAMSRFGLLSHQSTSPAFSRVALLQMHKMKIRPTCQGPDRANSLIVVLIGIVPIARSVLDHSSAAYAKRAIRSLNLVGCFALQFEKSRGPHLLQRCRHFYLRRRRICLAARSILGPH
jgi:hypothetical protein